MTAVRAERFASIALHSTSMALASAAIAACRPLGYVLALPQAAFCGVSLVTALLVTGDGLLAAGWLQGSGVFVALAGLAATGRGADGSPEEACFRLSAAAALLLLLAGYATYRELRASRDDDEDDGDAPLAWLFERAAASSRKEKDEDAGPWEADPFFRAFDR